jgi:hypothetical protein
MLRLEALIALLFASRNSQPFNLSANQLLKLVLPTLSGLGDEEEC